MSWRTVVIANRCKLDLKLGYMVIRGDETKRVYLDELAMLIIESTAVSMTCCLMAELIARKIKVIFCDSKRTPCAELMPYVGSHDSSRKIKLQTSWSDDIKGAVWTDIVIEKIAKQAEFLEYLGKTNEAAMLRGYMRDVEFADVTNREGHSAKVYFNAVFGMDFTRSTSCPVNVALNYGYSLLLSAFNREVAANGYLTQLGLHHDNIYNPFNLSCDLMEPFRPLVDRIVYERNFNIFGAEEKHKLLELLHDEVIIADSKQTVLNAVKIYVRSIFAALNDCNTSLIRYYCNEL